jgi:hypothetical protein
MKPSALVVSLALASAVPAQHGAPPVPFEGLDTLCTGAWWERAPAKFIDLRVPREQVVAFALYTVHAGVLKLSAQLYPLYPDESRTVRLELWRDGAFREAAQARVNDIGWSALFRIEAWDATRDVRYRVRHGERAAFEGTIRKDPIDRREIVLAALSCNSNKDRGPRASHVRGIRHQDPDLVFFAGDQSYDHKEHTAAWLLFGLQFRELFRDRPCVTIPDDHDIGQPNLWGEGGRVSTLAGCADGGYAYHPEYVKMVERCQTAHLPDPYDPTPIGQGIGTYYTRLLVGGVDFAILEDRKFKSGPAGKLPKLGPRPDHVTDPAYDPAAIDLGGLELLGARQLAFLADWGRQRDGVTMKAVLSQTGFCGGAHLHGTKQNRLHADLDSNGWPQRGRDAALRLIRDARAVHVAGDQHLATLVQHGIDAFRDGPWGFVVPAIVNDYYGRWWWPADDAPGADRDARSPLPWTGDYRDGFGNRITMHAYANPEAASGGAGWGLVRFDQGARTVTFECWPRDADPAEPGARQFPGWPKTVSVAPADPGRDGIVRVFVLAGQSNMEGKAQNALLERQAEDPATSAAFAHLRQDGRWRVRDDVFIDFLGRRGGLTIGYGSPDRTGLELELGTVLGDRFAEPVLLIKTAWGGHSLQKQFRPPSAGLPDAAALEAELEAAEKRVTERNAKEQRDDPLPTLDDIRGAYGESYRAMLREVARVLGEYESEFPALRGKRALVSGFVWFQGWNDQYGGAEQEYEANLRRLIADVRNDLGVPRLPFVIGVMGQNGSEPARGAMLAIQRAQLAMNDVPELAGTVRAVRTDVLVDTAAERLYPSWRERRDEWDLVGSDHPYHYLGSAIWFGRIGKALGEALLELIDR